MVFWHTADSWIRNDIAKQKWFNVFRIIGGFPSSFFFILAGVGVGIVWANNKEKFPWKKIAERGFWIWIAGYALGAQMWLVDAAAVFSKDGLLLSVLWLTLGGIYWFKTRFKTPQRFWLAALFTLVLIYLRTKTLSDAVVSARLLEFAILQGLGVSLMLSSALIRFWAPHMTATALCFCFVTLGFFVSLLSTTLELHLPGELPPEFAQWVARFPRNNMLSFYRNFPIFPRASFAFFGVAMGYFIIAQHFRPKTWVWLLGLLGCYLFYPANALYQTWAPVFPATKYLLRFMFDLSALCLLGPLALWLANQTGWIQGLVSQPLTLFGQNSLSLYWVHLEFVFGIIVVKIQHRMNIPIWTVSFFFFLWVMYRALLWWNATQRTHAPPTSARPGGNSGVRVNSSNSKS